MVVCQEDVLGSAQHGLPQASNAVDAGCLTAEPARYSVACVLDTSRKACGLRVDCDVAGLILD